ncbi:MAG: type II 3-dehydroquinate dehydratase [Spirochaetota bacterium]
MHIAVIQGPNINMLGTREADVYGTATMGSIHEQMRADAGTGHTIAFFQSNSEGDIVTAIQNLRGKTDWLIINPAAYTHTSVAIRDAILAVKIPVIEVHLSNIFKREEFRHRSFVSDIAEGILSGFGADGYRMALSYILSRGGRS